MRARACVHVRAPATNGLRRAMRRPKPQARHPLGAHSAHRSPASVACGAARAASSSGGALLLLFCSPRTHARPHTRAEGAGKTSLITAFITGMFQADGLPRVLPRVCALAGEREHTKPAHTPTHTHRTAPTAPHRTPRRPCRPRSTLSRRDCRAFSTRAAPTRTSRRATALCSLPTWCALCTACAAPVCSVFVCVFACLLACRLVGRSHRRALFRSVLLSLSLFFFFVSRSFLRRTATTPQTQARRSACATSGCAASSA